MPLSNSYIPYGVYFSSPFSRWQGALANEHALKLAGASTTRFLQSKGISGESFDSLLLGMTVPQKQSFYGAPWLAGLIGAAGITGPTLSQACATSVRLLASAAAEVELGMHSCTLGIACDRTSNGPLLVYPRSGSVGGRPDTEEWVWDNFNKDPLAKNPMIQTAENVAKEAGITREEQDAVTLLRAQQYEEALADDRAFQRRYMLPVEMKAGKKVVTLDADEGIHPTTAEGLAKLRPVLEGGTVTFGSQTHPADGHAGIVVATRERATSLAKSGAPTVQLLGFGSARVKKGFMPMAVVPAARQALQHADVQLADVAAIKTHNPFAVNDVYFSKEMGVKAEQVNRFGSPLVFGHPQGPTGLRAVIELVEELEMAGGGLGLFSGCAAGDTAMALVLRVG